MKSVLNILLLCLLLSTSFAENEKLGVFFGTFDPVHWGHKIIFSKVGKALNLNHLYVIPYPVNEGRVGEPLPRRYELLELSLENNPEVSMLSLRKIQNIFLHLREEKEGYEQKAFEEAVLEEIYYERGWDNQYYQIMGTDEFQSRYQRSPLEFKNRRKKLVVIKRPGFNQTIPRHLIPEIGRRIFILDLDTPAVSSSKVRELLRRGRETPFLDKDVRDKIRTNSWYKFASEE
jgi:nicotinate-nucleotide adenylyltransferase